MLLITIFWAWHFSQFSIHLTVHLSSQQFVNEDTMIASDASLAKVKVISILCSLLIHQASNFIIEGYQAGQAWFSLHKSILMTPNHLLVLNIFENGFQNYLLHHLSGYCGEAHRPVVPHILPPFLLEASHDTGTEILVLLWSLWPFKDTWDWPCNDICQLPQHLWMQPIGSHRFI